MFKRYTGNYIEVINALKLPSAFYQSLTECNLIQVDDPRELSYLRVDEAVDLSFSVISRRLGHKNGILFLQGTFYYIDQASQSIKTIVAMPEEQEVKDEEWLQLENTETQIVLDPDKQHYLIQLREIFAAMEVGKPRKALREELEIIGKITKQDTMTKEDYEAQVKKDLPRTSYLSLHLSVDQIKERLLDTCDFYDEVNQELVDAARPLSYTQGNFDGGVFTEGMIKTSMKYARGVVQAEMQDIGQNYFNSLRLCYIDDDGNNCAFALVSLRDDPYVEDEEDIEDLAMDIPVEERKHHFALVIIKNTASAAVNREVTYISHVNLLPENLSNKGEELSTQDLLLEIAPAINSTLLSQLLTGIWVDDSLVLDRFTQLKQRLKSNENLDDRDNKLPIFCNLYIIWARLQAEALGHHLDDQQEQLLNTLREEINRSIDDPHYFLHQSIEKIQGLVQQYENHPVTQALSLIQNSEQLKDSFSAIYKKYSSLQLKEKLTFDRNMASLHNRAFDQALQQPLVKRNQNFFLSGLMGSVLPQVVLSPSPACLVVSSGILASSAYKLVNSEYQLRTYQEELGEKEKELFDEYSSQVAPRNSEHHQEIVGVVQEDARLQEMLNARSGNNHFWQPRQRPTQNLHLNLLSFEGSEYATPKPQD